jgi:hypothetical protein
LAFRVVFRSYDTLVAVARAVRGVGPDLASGRSVFRAPKREPASHKVRPYPEKISVGSFRV